jgi:hypothetical protein
MTDEEQESHFIHAIQQRLEQLAAEFDLSTFFVIGALETILFDIKQDLLNTLNEDEDEEDLP